MEPEIHPFKVGQMAEVRTFEEGFRGSWFRCKIKKISTRKGRLGHILEYLDFPDEELKWTTLYQATFCNQGNTKVKHKELMLRPHYPPIYNEKQMPHASEISEVTVIVADSWRVGDLVDWWNSDCYWSGRITQLLDDNEAQEGDNGRPCARLVKPTDQGQETEAVQRPVGSMLSSPLSSNSDVADKAKSITTTETQTRSLGKRVSKKQKAKQDRSNSPGPVDSSTRKANQAVADSGQNGAEVAEDELKPGFPQKKVVLNSEHSHTLEAAVLDLEEYLNKVKWLKKILQYGISSSDAQSSQWQFI